MKKILGVIIVVMIMLAAACGKPERDLSTDEVVALLEEYVDNEYESHGRIVLEDYDSERVNYTVWNVVDKDGMPWDWVDGMVSTKLLKGSHH